MQRGLQRAWIQHKERYDRGVVKAKQKKYVQLQFYGAFLYNELGPCYTYKPEKEDKKLVAKVALEEENT